MSPPQKLTRREVLRAFGVGLCAAPVTALLACGSGPRSIIEPDPYPGTNEQLLEEIERTSFEFFWQEASPNTGQVRDRALASGNDNRTVSSIAATGFGLTALCIADQRGFRRTAELSDRTLKTLQFIAQMPHEHGFFYHFIDMNTGARIGVSEVSPIDSSLLLCGVLTARQHFADQQLKDLATTIYERVDWPWMLNGGTTLALAWTPENGFQNGRWDHYSELMMMYLLGHGSPTFPLDPQSWHAWTRPTYTYQGITYISAGDPLFTHQYSHAWFDFRNKRDSYADYYDNSVKATLAHKLFCVALRSAYPAYSEDLWGITASDSPYGYVVWGGPPPVGPIDGSVVPCAAGGSLPFLFSDCMRVMRTLRGRYGNQVWKKYGFVDAFNPNTGWVNPDVIGIDLGITMLMAENARTGSVWETFMKNAEAVDAMQKAGFQSA